MDLKELIKTSGNNLASIVDEGLEANDIKSYIDTGSYSLNALLSGSIYKGTPANKIFAFAGEEATGKTFFCLSILKNFMDMEKNGIVIYFDTEAALTSEIIEMKGIDKKRMAVFPVATIEHFKTQATRIVDKYIKDKEDKKELPPMFMVLDSLGNLSTNKEIKDTLEGSDTKDMTRAGLIKGAFRTLTMSMGYAGIPLFVTNHLYSNVGISYGPQKVQSGGSGLKYASSNIVYLSKRKEKDADKEVIGNIITCTLQKSRQTREYASVEILLSYKKGLDRYYGLLPIAEKYGIFKKVSTRYELPDGRKIFGSVINKDPEQFYTKEILDQIDEACKKEFCYGQEDEQVESENNNEELIDN